MSRREGKETSTRLAGDVVNGDRRILPDIDAGEIAVIAVAVDRRVRDIASPTVDSGRLCSGARFTLRDTSRKTVQP